ncbi:MAG: hypothetical protein Q9207_000772 [Kuettlingeria erythrocarpa]
MEARRSESSEPTLEALRMRHSEMLSAFDLYQQTKPSPGGAAIAHPTRENAVDPTPADKNTELRPKLEPQLDHAFVLCSVKGAGGAQPEMSAADAVPCGAAASFERHDSALGESLSEADMQKQEIPAPTSALIVKFSTTSPGRINSVERRGPASTPEVTQPSGGTHCDGPPQPQGSSATSDLPREKRKGGRPRGSKNKNPSRRGESQKLAKEMGKMREKYRTDVSDSHRGGSLMETRSIEMEQMHSSPGRRQRASYREPFEDLPGNSRRGRSISDTKLPTFSARPTLSAQPTTNHAILSSLRLHKTAHGSKVGRPSLSELPLLCSRDNALTEIFVRCIYPSLLSSREDYQGVLPYESLLAISKQVANDTVSQEFQTFLQKYQYQLNSEQRKSIRRYTRQAYAASVRRAHERKLTELTSDFTSQPPAFPDPNVATKQIKPEEQSDHSPANLDLDEGAAVAKPRGFEQAGKFETIAPARVTDEGRRLGLESDSILLTGLQDASIVGPEALVGHVKPEEARSPIKDCYQHVSKSFYGSNDSSVHGIDWNGILYTGPTYPQTQINTIHQVVQNENSIQSRSQPLSTSLTPKPPTASQPDLELAFANAILWEANGNRPYKSSKRGHYDFVREEYISILHILDELDQEPYENYMGDTIELRGLLRKRLANGIPSGELHSEQIMTRIIRKAHSGENGTALFSRKKSSIRAFLVDVAEYVIPSFAQPKLVKPTLEILDSASCRKDTVGSFLQNREAGLVGPGRHANLRATVETCIAKDIRPWRSWKGASSDVVTVAWAPDSYSYAAGAAAQSDENDLQYNRPRNLLFGSLVSNIICELPDHCVDRPKPEAVKESGNKGPNSTYAVYQACDPMVYKTVTSVQFAPTGETLYTASHDQTVKIWDMSEKRPICSKTLTHEAEVTSLEVTRHFPQHFATATKTADDSICIYWPAQHEDQDDYQTLKFASSRALKHRDRDIFPECIRWGLAPASKHYLLAGYQQWADHDYSPARQGQTCLWDINTEAEVAVRPHASAIFSIAWHPQENIFITGGAPGNGPLAFPRITKSVVRSYDVRDMLTFTHEFECQALDMQDVTFHPNSSSYVTAGCTDGTIYVWDYRWPDKYMHKLHHGQPLQELAANEEELPYVEHREKVDAGVMLSIWAESGSLLYTGSSDGVIKAWDIRLSPEDVWVKDVARLPAGVQSGALSPDGMNLLVGDAVGGIHVLSATRFGSDDDERLEYNPDPINFHYADSRKGAVDGDNPGMEGIEVANHLLKSGALVLDPLFGVGKGPNYDGPIAECARWNNLLTGYKELLPEIDRQQAFSTFGYEQKDYSNKIRKLITARREQMLAAKDDTGPLSVSFGPAVPFVAGKHSAASKTATVAELKGKHVQTVPLRPTESRSPAPKATPPLKPTVSEPIGRNLDDNLIYISSSPVKRKRFPSVPTTPSKRIKTEIVTPSERQSKHPQLPRSELKVEVVDLTGDGDDELAPPAPATSRNGHPSVVFGARPTRAKAEPNAKKGSLVVESIQADALAEEDNLLSWEEWVEEDHWWPKDC